MNEEPDNSRWILLSRDLNTIVVRAEHVERELAASTPPDPLDVLSALTTLSDIVAACNSSIGYLATDMHYSTPFSPTTSNGNSHSAGPGGAAPLNKETHDGLPTAPVHTEETILTPDPPAAWSQDFSDSMDYIQEEHSESPHDSEGEVWSP